jgi:Leucine-rich repeat (LRR) protein
VLKSVENKFKTIAVFKNMPKLEELWASNNNIASLVGLDGVPALKKLHLRHNKIEKIEEEGLPDLQALEYLNLRTNKIADLENLFRLFAAFPAVK